MQASLVTQMVKNPPAMWEIWVQSLGWEDPLEEGMATHSSILAWRIPWTEKPGGLQSMGSQRVGHNWVSCWATKHSTQHTHGHTHTPRNYTDTQFSILPQCAYPFAPTYLALYINNDELMPVLPIPIQHHQIQSTFPALSVPDSQYFLLIWLISCLPAKSLQSWPTLCNPKDCSPSGSSVQGTLQARILECVAMPSSRGSFRPRDQTRVSYVFWIGRPALYH